MKLNGNSQKYDRSKLFVMFLLLISALAIDVSISDVTPEATFWGIVTFTIIAGIFIVGQFIILNMIKAKNNEIKFHSQPNIARLDKPVLAAIMVLVVLQMLAISHYYTHLLAVAVTVSYGLAAFLLGLPPCDISIRIGVLYCRY